MSQAIKSCYKDSWTEREKERERFHNKLIIRINETNQTCNLSKYAYKIF
jgi:hypothetical protein